MPDALQRRGLRFLFVGATLALLVEPLSFYLLANGAFGIFPILRALGIVCLTAAVYGRSSIARTLFVILMLWWGATHAYEAIAYEAPYAAIAAGLRFAAALVISRRPVTTWISQPIAQDPDLSIEGQASAPVEFRHDRGNSE